MDKHETILRRVSDEDFAWMLSGEPAHRDGLQLPPGGVDEPAVLAHVREITKRVHAEGCTGAWMIVSDNEVVGLCGFHDAPRNGQTEIGYSVAASRRRRGHATRALHAMVAEAVAEGLVLLTAETSTANLASNRVLEKNGFVQTGTRVDAADGEILKWQKVLARSGRTAQAHLN
jgi:RimJ/RimL family protein N-acetyltransferase